MRSHHALSQSFRFPMLMFATPWPFDSLSGLPDRHAELADAIEPLFPNLDGALARLRREVPDAEARFRAYQSLEMAWATDTTRLARFEERRLAAMDHKYGCDIGEHILHGLVVVIIISREAWDF